MQPKRDCFHPGTSSLSRDQIALSVPGKVTGTDMIKAMMAYIWPKDDNKVKKQVSIAVGLLVGAKVLNVTVPFIFKYAIDGLNTGMNLNTPVDTVLTAATSLMIACK